MSEISDLSGDNFLWTSDSSDSDLSCDINRTTSKVFEDKDLSSISNMTDSEKSKGKKKRIKEEVLTENEESSVLKKKIKSEPIDKQTPKKKKKSKGNAIEDSFDPEEESYLKQRVQEEICMNLKRKIKTESTDDENVNKKKKRKSKEYVNGCNGHDSNTNIHSDDGDEKYLNSLVAEEQTISKKKKKKSHKKDKTLSESDNNLGTQIKNEKNCHIEETMDDSTTQLNEDETDHAISKSYFSAEESVVQDPISDYNKKKKKKKKRKTSEDIITENTEDIEISRISLENGLESETLENNAQSQKKDKRISFDQNNINPINDSETSERLNMTMPAQISRRKLSERIAFEDDSLMFSNADSHLNTTVQQKSELINKFIKKHDGLTIIDPSITEAAVSSDEEAWLVKCPSEVNVDCFKNVNLALESKCKVKVDGNTYEGSVIESDDKLTVTSAKDNKYILHTLPLQGKLYFHRRIPKSVVTLDGVSSSSTFVPLPETKCRHPFFGAHFKSAMRIPSSIKQRLKNVRNATSECDEIASEVETPIKKQKKKKRKHSDNGEESAPKAKKSKKEKKSENTWDSEKAIEENLFNF